MKRCNLIPHAATEHIKAVINYTKIDTGSTTDVL